MNNYFCNVGRNINNKLPSVEGSFTNYMKNEIRHTFFLAPVLDIEVKRELIKLNPRKSSGPDNITPKLARECAEQLKKPLTLLYNKSILNAIYPSKLKLAKVIALYKKKSHSVPSNYRPISLLNCFNKIFEKLIHVQMTNFIEKHKILYINQFGFRKYHSTTLALIDTVDFIRKHINNKEYVLGIFLDVEKAFDSIDHSVLLKKLAHYGFRGHVNSFLSSYLAGRMQYTYINGCESQHLAINYGVPQGSILGPLLFILFVNDISESVPGSKCNLFADDTSVLIHHKDINVLKQEGETIARNIYKWFVLNRLSLSICKSNFVLFRGKKKNANIDFNEIKLDHDSIPRASFVKYIGIYIDETLSWNKHITEVCKSLVKYFTVFYNIRKGISKHLARTIYYTCIYSRIKYGIEIYGSNSGLKMQKIQTLQNKLLKILLKKDYMFSTNRLHRELRILKVQDIYRHSTLQFVYKCVNGKIITKFKKYFKKREDIHNHTTRNIHRLETPQINTEVGRSQTNYTGAVMWNNLESYLVASKTENSFKKNIFNNFLTKYTVID